MIRTPVASTSVFAVGYDPARRLLEVEFTRGAIYQYENVPETIFQEFMNTPPKGPFYNAHIRLCPVSSLAPKAFNTTESALAGM